MYVSNNLECKFPYLYLLAQNLKFKLGIRHPYPVSPLSTADSTHYTYMCMYSKFVRYFWVCTNNEATSDGFVNKTCNSVPNKQTRIYLNTNRLKYCISVDYLIHPTRWLDMHSFMVL